METEKLPRLPGTGQGGRRKTKLATPTVFQRNAQPLSEKLKIESDTIEMKNMSKILFGHQNPDSDARLSCKEAYGLGERL